MTKTVEGKERKGQGEQKALPGGWRWVKLENLCSISTGTTPSTKCKDYYEGSTPFIKTAEVRNDRIKEASIFVSQKAIEDYRLKVYPPGTVLMAMYGQGKTRGQVSILEIAATTTQNAAAMVPSSALVSEFLWYWLLGQYGHLRLMGFQGDLSHLSLKLVKGLEIPLPPIAEQKRIVAILSDRLATVDQVRLATQNQLEAAQTLPAAYLRQVFNSPKAQRWEKKSLGKILKRRNDIIHPRDNPSGPATFVGLEHIQSEIGTRLGSIDVETSELTGRKPRFYKGDIVYGYLRPYLNKVWIAEFDGLCSVDQYVYTTKSKNTSTEFMAWFMRSPVYMERAPVDLTPGQLPRIRADEVASTEINIPDFETQRETVLTIDKAMTETLHIQKSLQDQLDAINALPAALLRQAFNGEL